ncbi:MAG TPA: DinB family protein [Candidatus Nanopelagicales bacterium]|jgi:hypothetical protein|nr:DinB family protein [Candidatus Nanopelagicales bacterium]
MNPTPNAGQARERADLLATLNQHRYFLRFTARGLTEEQARTAPTVSALTVGGLIHHVSEVEARWVAFTTQGAAAFEQVAWTGGEAATDRLALPAGRTLAEALAEYDRVADRTAQVVAALVDLDADHELPTAPWFEPGARWSARRALLHVIAETAQHAGHADIVREAIDGQKTMG